LHPTETSVIDVIGASRWIAVGVNVGRSEREKPDNEQPSLDVIYQEICNNYRAIDDLRMKLMGALPLASGIGILLPVSGVSNFQKWFNEPTGFLLLPLGLFGFLITFGLFLFEHRGMQRCMGLIKAGEEIEDRVKGAKEAPKGSFLSTPRRVRVVSRHPLEEEDNHSKEDNHSSSISADARGTARVIYPTVLATWVCVFFVKFYFWIGTALLGDLGGKLYGVISAVAITLSSFVLFFCLSTKLLAKFEEQVNSSKKETCRVGAS
jgi:hypothetical protein